MTQDETQMKIKQLFINFSAFLCEKNKRYGNSALEPIQIFSKASAETQICNRLDDKLGRIKHAKKLLKNDVADVFGYSALVMVKNNWLEFDDLLD